MPVEIKITDLTELTNGNVASGDLFEIVDVSDTTSSAEGTSKKVTITSLTTAIAPNAATWDSTASTVSANSAIWDKASTIITTGSATEFLAKDGTYYSVSASPAGSNTQVQYNNSGSFGASSGVTIVSDNLTLDKGGLVNTVFNVNGSNDWSLIATSTDTFKLRNTTSASDVFEVDSSNNMTINGNLTLSGATATYIPYFGAGGVIAQSANFVYDYTNERFGIGTSSPSASLHVVGNSVSGAIGEKVGLLEGVFPELQFRDTSYTNGFFMTQYGNNLYMGRTSSSGTYLNYIGMFQLSSGKWSVGHGSNPLAQLDLRIQNSAVPGFSLTAANSQSENLINVTSYGGTAGDLFKVASNGKVTLANTLMQFGGTSSSWSAIKANGTELQIRLADDSGYAGLNTGGLKTNGNVNMSSLPTSSAGLSAGDLWRDGSGHLRIV